MASNIVMVRSKGPAGPHKTARALGWFSIALGIAELVAPLRSSGFAG
jgi:hypothetical protein